MKEKIKFLIDMLNAFEFLRIKDIVHRDLKPENILYSRKDGCYKIADFALAISEEEPINKLVGTPGYISPELFKSEEDIFANQYSDIYSLGLIYY
jgi:serine/threonine protein kinase